MSLVGLSRPLTLTWLEDGNTVGVSAPLDIWIGQLVLSLSNETRARVIDNVIAEVKRYNELEAAEREELDSVVEPGAEQFDDDGNFIPEEEDDASPAGSDQDSD